MKLNKQNAHVIAVCIHVVCRYTIISLILLSNDSKGKIPSNHVSNMNKKKLLIKLPAWLPHV